MKRSPLIQGLILVLVAILIGAYFLHRTVRFPKVIVPKAARPAAIETPIPTATAEAQVPAEAPPSPPTPPRFPAPAPPAPIPSHRVIPKTGRVEDARGQRVPFATVEGFALDLRGVLMRLAAETDAQGEFRVDCPEQTHITFTAHLPGFGRAFFNVPLGGKDDPFNPTGPILLVLKNPIDFEGVVARAGGAPAAGARLRFHPFSVKYLDADGVSFARNLLIGAMPPDVKWDANCRTSLFLTDCTVTADAQGKFQANSLLSSTSYLVEVEQTGSSTVVVEIYVRSQKTGNVIQLPP